MATNLTTFSPGVAQSQFMKNFAVDPSTTTGLTFGYTAGIRTLAGETVNISAGTLPLAASADNWIAASASGIAVQIDEPTTASAIYKIVTDGSGITSISDYRGAIPTSKAVAW